MELPVMDVELAQLWVLDTSAVFVMISICAAHVNPRRTILTLYWRLGNMARLQSSSNALTNTQRFQCRDLRWIGARPLRRVIRRWSTTLDLWKRTLEIDSRLCRCSSLRRSGLSETMEKPIGLRTLCLFRLMETIWRLFLRRLRAWLDQERKSLLNWL